MKKVIPASVIIICISVFIGICLTTVKAKSSHDQLNFSDIDTYINSQMAEYHIPGLALAIVQGDQIVYLRGYGMANSSGQAVTPQTPFLIGSTGKSITATAIMMLVEAGKVNLDAPVQQYLPWFRLADEQASARITLRMLLNQTSGIPVNAGVASQGHSDISDGALEKQIRSLSSVELNHTPGMYYEYANANYQIIGMVVQQVSGQSFQSFIQQKIYTPLDMRNCYTSREAARKNGMATGYRYWFGFPLATKNLPYSYRQFPSGWYICDVEGLAHFLIMQMNDGVYNGQALVSPEGVAEMHRPALNGYAMGWVVENELISHNGGMPDYGSELYFNTRTHYGVVVAFNANTGYFYTPSYVIAPSVLQMLSGGQPFNPIPDAWYRTMLLVLAVTLSVQVIWIILSALLLKRWGTLDERHPKSLAGKITWLALPLLIEAGLAIYIISTLQANDRTILVAYIYQPDITLLALLSLILAVGWGLLRTALSLRLLTRRLA